MEVVQYIGDDGYCIVKIAENKVYYGNGRDTNAFGVSANQFLRFNPYMRYVGDNNQKPSNAVGNWISKHK